MFGSHCARPNKMFTLFGLLVAYHSLNRLHALTETVVSPSQFGVSIQIVDNRLNEIFTRIAIELIGIEICEFVLLCRRCVVNEKVNQNSNYRMK